MLKQTPNSSFQTAVDRLNSKYAPDLWVATSLLSALNLFSALNNDYFFMLELIHFEKIQMLQRAMIESKASNTKRGRLKPSDIPFLWNAMRDASQRPKLLEGTDDNEIKAIRLIATLGNSQLRPQLNTTLLRVGRIYGILQIIPTQYRSELQSSSTPGALETLSAIPTKLGLDVGSFLAIGLAIMTCYCQAFEQEFPINLDSVRAELSSILKGFRAEEYKLNVIISIITETSNVVPHWTFTLQSLVQPDHPSLSVAHIEAYLRLMACPHRALRDLSITAPYQQYGDRPDQLHPLERFPIVDLEDGRYCVPNLHYFSLAITEMLHYLLQEAFPKPKNEYNVAYGHLQEYYLKEVLSHSLPDLTLIPEQVYRNGKQQCRGPDIVVIDPMQHTLIAIESKGKRLRVASRIQPVSKEFLDDFEDVFKALKRLPVKIAALNDGLPEYAEWQTVIKASTKPALLVIVMSEGGWLLPEVLHALLKDEPNHIWNTCPLPICIIDLMTFELAVALAGEGQGTLYDLLIAYVQESRSLSIQSEAQVFGGRVLSYPDRTYTGLLAPKVFQLLAPNSELGI